MTRRRQPRQGGERVEHRPRWPSRRSTRRRARREHGKHTERDVAKSAETAAAQGRRRPSPVRCRDQVRHPPRDPAARLRPCRHPAVRWLRRRARRLAVGQSGRCARSRSGPRPRRPAGAPARRSSRQCRGDEWALGQGEDRHNPTAGAGGPAAHRRGPQRVASGAGTRWMQWSIAPAAPVPAPPPSGLTQLDGCHKVCSNR